MTKEELKNLTNELLKLRNGDMSALDAIYEMTRKGVFSFVYPYFKEREKSEDLTQQTYIQVYEKINQFDESKNPLNWILTIAKNLSLNELNKANREVALDFQDPVNDSKTFTYDKNLETPTIDLAKKVLDKDELRIVMMFAVGEYKHREIADALKLPIGTVTWKYSRAIKKLKKALEGQK